MVRSRDRESDHHDKDYRPFRLEAHDWGPGLLSPLCIRWSRKKFTGHHHGVTESAGEKRPVNDTFEPQMGDQSQWTLTPVVPGGSANAGA